MAGDELLSVEVVYADVQEQAVITLQVPDGTTVLNAIALSGLLDRNPEVKAARVGIFGRVVPAHTVVRDGDRIEIYRPLIADPKLARRRRAARQA